ncbi:hypothetical protein KC319_g14 [Hortaea werneckii]|nr:hypothetical protein KC319_g14 [Hortaea werneckii]
MFLVSDVLQRSTLPIPRFKRLTNALNPGSARLLIRPLNDAREFGGGLSQKARCQPTNQSPARHVLAHRYSHLSVDSCALGALSISGGCVAGPAAGHGVLLRSPLELPRSVMFGRFPVLGWTTGVRLGSVECPAGFRRCEF